MKLVLAHSLLGRNSSPHMGILCLAAYVRKEFPEIKVRVVEEVEVVDTILKWKPDLVGFTADTIAIGKTTEAVQKIKRKLKAPLILGGVHVTACPQTLPGCFDVGVVGEGEVTLGEILKLYKEKGKLTKKDLREIKGLVFWQGKKIVNTGRREFIKDIDSLPIPARDLVEMEKNYLTNQVNLYGVKRAVNVMTSRGCPYHCVYCGSPVQWGFVRVHSPEYIIKEIESILEAYSADSIIFSDDLFIFPKDRLLRLVELIRERGWHKKIVFTGFGRANMMDEQVARALKKIGVKKLTFGFESYSEGMLSYLKDHSVTVKENIRAINICHKYGIAVASGLIVGSPGETIEDLKETYRVMTKYPMENTQIYLLTPYPGTKIWADASKRGLVSLGMDMDRLFVQIPLWASIMFWRKDKFSFLKDRIFLNTERINDMDYLEMILKMNRLAWWQNLQYYLKQLFVDKDLGYRLLKSRFANR